jgi:hypothetical protein
MAVANFQRFQQYLNVCVQPLLINPALDNVPSPVEGVGIRVMHFNMPNVGCQVSSSV